MRVAIDACCWSNRRGFGRFTRELLAPLVVRAADAGHQPVLVVDRDTAEEAAAEGGFPAGAELEVVATRRQPTRAAAAGGARSPVDLWRMRRGALRTRPDVFFFPAVYSYYPLPRRIPTVVTFHDAIAEAHPELVFPDLRGRLFWRLKTRLALRRAARVLTVSEDARRQIAAAFGYPAEGIAVTGEAPAAGLAPVGDDERLAAVRRRHRLPEGVPILLYVGGISPHKNLGGLVAAASRLDGPWHLVLAGDHRADGFLDCHRELTGRIAELGLGDRVTFTGFVPNDELAALYTLATVVVLPSFSEGFGLPVVEAMACGVPVAVSRAGSLPEVAGEGGVLFDPRDPAGMAAAIGRLLADPELRRRLGEAGLERARSFTWEGSARRVLELLEEAAGVGRSLRR